MQSSSTIHQAQGQTRFANCSGSEDAAFGLGIGRLLKLCRIYPAKWIPERGKIYCNARLSKGDLQTRGRSSEVFSQFHSHLLFLLNLFFRAEVADNAANARFVF